jgi:hypothetical protein
MSNSINTTNKKPLEPTAPHTPDINELARLWVELLLPQINRDEVVHPKPSNYNKTIGQ